MYYNASLFNIEGNYSVSLSVNVTQNAESQGGRSLAVTSVQSLPMRKRYLPI
jgi:hypothetical protein